MTVNKPKVPKGLSYIIKSSQLKALFEELKLDIDVSVNYSVSKEGPEGIRVFECLYWLPNMNVSYDRLYITIGTVNISNKEKISILLKELFPKFKEWILFLLSQPENSTLIKHDSYIRANFINDEFVLKSEPDYTSSS
ncbi:hypothetical protein [Pedobacter sp. MC2016-24]|uniref:hypothetical protein n=1 Tax=Pedobacter sp. MC2016-24 TaxID=2780090 RepID=UPI0018824DAF|nr:hypothetical protein [Pedobacter sp. MC2016-24]MBE9597980.1 hypothetical protein [Pedobacter sp. MC2016-24]